MNAKNDLFSFKSIQELKNLGHIQIQTYDDEGNFKTVHFNKAEGNTVKIGYYKNHYFLNEEIQLSKLWI